MFAKENEVKWNTDDSMRNYNGGFLLENIHSLFHGEFRLSEKARLRSEFSRKYLQPVLDSFIEDRRDCVILVFPVKSLDYRRATRCKTSFLRATLIRAIPSHYNTIYCRKCAAENAYFKTEI